MRIAAVVMVALFLSGCANTISGKATPEPVKLDCDLIFPGPGSR